MKYGKVIILVVGLFVQGLDIHAGPVLSKIVDSAIELERYTDKFIDNYAGETLFAVVGLIAFYESGRCVRRNLTVHEQCAIEEQSKKDIKNCQEIEEKEYLKNINSHKQRAFNFFDEQLKKAVCTGNKNKILQYLEIIEGIKIPQNYDDMPPLEAIPE